MFLKYFHTIRHFRPGQIVYILRYRIRHYFSGFLISKINSVPVEIDCEMVVPKVSFLSYPWFQADDIKIGKYKFLNEEAEYGGNIQWNDQSKIRLWRYNLHYFHYLFPEDGLPQHIGLKLISDWIEENPPLTENAWEPYPTSLRIVNWIKYLSIAEKSGKEFKQIYKSLYQQTLYLEKSLEFDQLGNHIFKNIKALVFAGLFFSSKDSEKWLKKSVNLLRSEIDDEVLSDGGHIERSPMYHSMILEDCLDLLNILMNHSRTDFREIVDHLSKVVRKMLEFLIGIIHPDGQIPLMNDAVHGVEVHSSQLLSYFQQLTNSSIDFKKSEINAFPASGYFTMKPKPGNFLIVDCGPIGPDYQPGHGHCDTLSFELSVNRERVIVDSGCFNYEKSKIREYNRGNLGHNTLTIDGKNQSEIWDAFRCAKRAYPLEPKIRMNDDELLFEGGHDGYKRLKGNLIHRRHISWKEDIIVIEDEITGKHKHNFLLTLNFHPSYSIHLKDGTAHINLGNETRFLIQPLYKGELSVTKGWYCPEFGKKIQNSVLMQGAFEEAPFKVGWDIRII